MDGFTVLTKRQLKRLSVKDREEYQRAANEYFGNLQNQLANYEEKEKLHPFLLAGVTLFPFVKIRKLNDLKWPEDNGPVIFSVNHSSSKDFPVISRLIKEHFFIMADYTMQNDRFVDMLNKANGCIYVDRKSKKSGKNAIAQAIEGVNNGYNMAIFAEGTWNLLEDELILPRKWGDLKTAQETGRPIMPIVLEHIGSFCFAKFGNLRYVGENANLEQVDQELHNEMTELRKSIREEEECKKRRESISYEDWLRKTIKGYKYFDVEYEISTIRKSEDYHKQEFDYILKVGEEIRPTSEIEKQLKLSKINYRIK